ncbi:hypothetical protein [Jiella marina]|uniref:hypothetical protein n=1 Tax=Jiella sp. LLJ827 TaxID=2917712 RepID=UPI002101743D|nr:hypothetical protein [Jiella sp. LLJ827]MCQ0990604.1 hypothetical protein [Jiella sp. LLJ827]
MNDKNMTFADFMTDKDGEYTKAKMLSAARALIAEGRRPRRVVAAIIESAREIAKDQGDKFYWRFACDLEKRAQIMLECEEERLTMLRNTLVELEKQLANPH